MKPAPPLALDGLPLPDVLRARFARLIDSIHAFDPLRPSHTVLHLAEQALRKTCTLTPAGWISLRSYVLNDGKGPSMRLR